MNHIFMQFAYLNMGRLSIHPRPQKWRSTMTPNTAFSVNFMRISFLIAQLWLKLWHSLYRDWLQCLCDTMVVFCSNTFLGRQKFIRLFKMIYVFCRSQREWGSNFIFSQPFAKINCKAISYSIFWSMIHLSFFVSISFVLRNFQVNSNASFFS